MTLMHDDISGWAAASPGGTRQKWRAPGHKKRPAMFLAIFGAWVFALGYFGPRLFSLSELATSPWALASIVFFVVFAQIAWLYGFYNLAVVAFAAWRRAFGKAALPPPGATPAVAVLYTTCDDFVERSAASCVALTYPDYHVYILDDSRTAPMQARVDAFASQHLGRVTVVRRPDRSGFKAGNLNYALQHVAHEPLFAVVDADEVLPHDFLTRLTPYLTADERCGFVQANHRSRPGAKGRLARDLGIGIDIHWKWYQPLRNEYGFVMFLGHGALLRRSCWAEVGGFPEIVSEDLGYAIAIRERGYVGAFAQEVICYEEFPGTVAAFRVRHVKWTRGTCEFLHRWMGRLLRARNITTTEKLDILFPTLNLPLTFAFFLYMINAALILPMALGQMQDVTFVLLGREIVVPTVGFKPGIERVFGWDFYAITLLTILSPILCFIIELASKPLRLLRFLTHSTALYAALSPLSFIAVIGYALTRKAQFLVTGVAATRERPQDWRGLFARTHPSATAIQSFEIAAGAGFLAAAVMTFQIGFAGVAIGFLMLPLMHDRGWRRGVPGAMIWVPAAMMGLSVALGGLGVLGLQPVFFGFGFHF
jgi:cellulose synthase/poly-beta-1,6-N-acetylglucosamine synthase-like glycosyltransferase